MTNFAIRDQEILEGRVRDLVNDLLERLDLGWLSVSVKFDQRNNPDSVVCDALAQWEYRQVSLVWNLFQVATQTDADLERVAVHELVHALNAPLWCSLSATQQEKLRTVNELATENVARVISHILENRA